jgi:gamma-tubulin complex component 2
MRCHTCAEYSTDGTYVPLIHQAFAAASASLMELMMQRKGLPDMLQAFKSYFLLARGDLFTTFLELAEAELERNAADVTVTRLQSLLELGRLMAAQDCLLHP